MIGGMKLHPKLQTVSRNIYHKINGLSFYVKALLLGIPISSGLLAYLLSQGAADLVFSDWFITLISVPTFFANQLASAAYAGTIVDMFHQFKEKPTRHRELAGTLLGVSAGIAVGIGLSCMHVAVPLASSLYAFANVLFTLRQINIFAGFGNRVGRCADKDSRPMSEKIIVASAGLLGLTLGIILFATCTASMISVVGITSFFSGGIAIPAWIAGIIFIISVSSGLASSADYASKAISFIQSAFSSKDKMVADTVKKKKCEYGGSLLGLTLGLMIGGTIIGAILITNPPLLAGVVGVIAGTLIVITAAGMIGSIGSRLGRIIDGFIQSKNDPMNTDHIVMKPPSRRRHSTTEITQPELLIKQLPLRRVKSESEISIYKNSLFYPKPTMQTKVDCLPRSRYLINPP